MLSNVYNKHCHRVISLAIVADAEIRLFPCTVLKCIALKICLRPSSFEREEKESEREKAAFSSSVLRKEKCGSHTPTHSLPVIPPTSTDSSVSLALSQLFVFLFSAPCFPHPLLFYSFSSSFQIVRCVSMHNDTCPSFPLGFFLNLHVVLSCLCMHMSSQCLFPSASNPDSPLFPPSLVTPV